MLNLKLINSVVDKFVTQLNLNYKSSFQFEFESGGFNDYYDRLTKSKLTNLRRAHHHIPVVVKILANRSWGSGSDYTPGGDFKFGVLLDLITNLNFNVKEGLRDLDYLDSKIYRAVLDALDVVGYCYVRFNISLNSLFRWHDGDHGSPVIGRPDVLTIVKSDNRVVNCPLYFIPAFK